MSAHPEAARPVTSTRSRGGVWRLVKHHALTVYAVLAIVYLLLPIAVVILFSFNRPAGRFNYVWREVTLVNWRSGDGGPHALYEVIELEQAPAPLAFGEHRCQPSA